MDLTIQPRGDILCATGAGKVSLPDAVAHWKEIFDAANAGGLKNILADFTSVTTVLSATERFEMGRMMADYAIANAMVYRIALIGLPPVVDGFGALVFSNRSMGIKIFSDRQGALDWLNQSQ